jgi:hypothetical protein
LEEGKVKKVLIIGLMASLAACSGKIDKLPCPPEKPAEVITRDVPVPVLCTVEIERVQAAIDNAQTGMKLEGQNAMLRQTIAEQKAYIVKLEAGVTGCGGKIK